MAPNILAEIPSANANVLVLSIYLPTTGEGWPKAMRHESACLLRGPNVDYQCHRPAKTLIKFQEKGGTVTHSLQVLPTLLHTLLFSTYHKHRGCRTMFLAMVQ